MKENRSSIVGFALIGVIMLAFSWYNTKQFEKRQKEAFTRDSLAAAAAIQQGAVTDSSAVAAVDSLTEPETLIPEEEGDYQEPYLNAASKAETAFYTLENDKLRIRISSKGAQPDEVLVKDYFTHDSSALFLVQPGKSRFDLELNTNQWLNSSDLNFAPVESTDSTLTLRLQFAESSWIDAVWSLASDSYMADYQLHFVGMDQALDRRTGQMNLKWVLDVPRLEKGYQNERNYSGVAYKYLNGNEVKSLGKRRDSAHETFNSTLRWIGFQQQFFSAILVSENGFPAGTLSNQFYPEDDPGHNLMQSGAEMTVALDTQSSDFTLPFRFYFGPNHFYTLRGYD